MLYEIQATCLNGNGESKTYRSIITTDYEVRYHAATEMSCEYYEVGGHKEGKNRKTWIPIFNNPMSVRKHRDEFSNGGSIVIKEATTGRRIQTVNLEGSIKL